MKDWLKPMASAMVACAWISFGLSALPTMAARSSYTHLSSGIINPSSFRGYVKTAYQAAAAHPALAMKLFCYCGCDKEAGHHSLIDCYRSDHALYCTTCKDEMVRAAAYQNQGMAIADIQHKIDREFSMAYPFGRPSSALSTYRRSEGYASKNKNIASKGGKAVASKTTKASKTVASTKKSVATDKHM